MDTGIFICENTFNFKIIFYNFIIKHLLGYIDIPDIILYDK